MEYTVSRGVIGKRKVSFTCACGEGITTTLESAGQYLNCPTCGCSHLVPGTPELEADRASERVRAQKTRPATQARSAGPARNSEAAAALASMTPSVPTPTISYATSSMTPPTRQAPSYLGLSIASSVLAIYAGILYVLGLIAVITALYYHLTAARSSVTFSPWIDITAMLTPGVAILFFGAMGHGMSTALKALRDIAINSFRS